MTSIGLFDVMSYNSLFGGMRIELLFISHKRLIRHYIRSNKKPKVVVHINFVNIPLAYELRVPRPVMLLYDYSWEIWSRVFVGGVRNGYALHIFLN